ncbi:type I restriction endonuclease [Wielerella bovis]|uniref:type I restriction endonuclease n=1 Tax=Wielerella bovis TaxID=2917790 RepID=UPI002019CA72|nr:type I restriction endonuclease [Wielerella bovis]ULJ68156.1 type I restriction endonuclease [Wielerella bovis]
MLVNLYAKLGLSPDATSDQIRAVLDRFDNQVSKPEQKDQIAQVRRMLLTPANREQYDARLFEQYPELRQTSKNSVKNKPVSISESTPIQEQVKIIKKEISDEFKNKLKNHSEHVRNVAKLCNSEETTKQALILPMLDILGFSAFDPSKVRAEYQADFQGVKHGERVDYALFCDDQAVMYIEAKAHNENITNHAPQLARYFNSSPNISVCAVTNGQEWRFFTDLENKNIMDKTPFLTIDVCELSDSDIEQLCAFRFDQFQPDSLRVLAEENVYLSAFTNAISSSLKEVDLDFVRFIAGKANIQKQFTQKFLENVRPLAKRALENTLSTMLVSGLNQKENTKQSEAQIAQFSEFDDIIDPNNPRIITTWNERRLFEIVQSILSPDAKIEAKDTESYYSVLVNGKSNRWICRYFDHKKRPSIVLPIELTENDIQLIKYSGLEVSGNHIIIDTPENALRIAVLLREAYHFCDDDNNFRRK